MTAPVILAIILIAAAWAVIIPLAIRAHRAAKLDALTRGMEAFAAAHDDLADGVRRMGEAFTAVGTALADLKGDVVWRDPAPMGREAWQRAADSITTYLAVDKP